MRALAALAAAVALAGCGSQDTGGGGRAPGETVAVHSLLPDGGVTHDIVDGQKLALAEARARAGAFTVLLTIDRLPTGDPEAAASAAREAVEDLQIVAAISDLDSDTARATVPLFNAAGILHLSPGATYPGFLAAFPGAEAGEPGRWQPSRERTFAPLAPSDLEQAVAIADFARGPVMLEVEVGAEPALAEALARRLAGRLVTEPRRASTIVYVGDDRVAAARALRSLAREAPRARILLPESLLRAGLEIPRGVDARFLTSAPAVTIGVRFRERFGRCASRYAQLGYEAMRSLIGAVARAGEDGSDRRVLARTWFATERPRPVFELVRHDGCP